MSLSFTEKRSLQKSVNSCLASLAEKLDFKAKRAFQKQLNDALSKLGEGAAKKIQSLLDRFVAGEFTKVEPIVFMDKLREVESEVAGDISPLLAPFEKFMEYHEKPVLEGVEPDSLREGVFESATADISLSPSSTKAPTAAVRIMPSGLEYGSPQTITIDIDTDFDSPETFREIIRSIEQARAVDTLILKINSHGGRTDSAQAIYVALLETKAKTVAKIITAYSSGSIVAMACDEIRPTPHCTMMIHNASTGAWGKLGDMKAQSTFMENHFKKWFAELYSGFLTGEEIEDVFKGQDIWLREEEISERLKKWHPIREKRDAPAD